MTGGGDDDVVPVSVVDRNGFVVNLRVCNHGGDIVSRMLAPILGDLGEVAFEIKNDIIDVGNLERALHIRVCSAK